MWRIKAAAIAILLLASAGHSIRGSVVSASGGQSLRTQDQGLWLGAHMAGAGSVQITASFTNLTPRYYGWANPFASISISEAVVYVNPASATKLGRLAIFDSLCTTKLGESNTFSVGTAGSVLVTFPSAVVITGSYIYVGFMTDAASATVSLGSQDGTTAEGIVQNLGTAASQIFHGPAEVSLSFPSSCGTRTALTGFANYAPGVFARP